MNGDVLLRVEGLMLERLVQRALDEGARFRSIQRDGPRAMIFETDPFSAAVLTGLCERFSLPCRVLSRRGRDAMLRRLKRRATLLAGAFTLTATLALFFSRIWMVDVVPTGDRTADMRPLKSALTDLGIRPGISKTSVDPALLEGALSVASPDFSFIGVRIQGVRLLVEASPAVPAPEVYELDGSRDLVAVCDGVVESLSVLSGMACVQPGDTVIRGQVLIRGDERVTKEENRSIAALGTVLARTWHEGCASAPLTTTAEKRTGRSSRSSELRLLNWSWPLTRGEDFPSQEIEVELLPIGGLFLPLQIRRVTAFETKAHTASADLPALKRQLSLLAFAQAGTNMIQSHPDGCEIVDRWIEYTRDSTTLRARAVYETRTNIAVTGDALYQQGG